MKQLQQRLDIIIRMIGIINLKIDELNKRYEEKLNE